jgi:hypothetical protein
MPDVFSRDLTLSEPFNPLNSPDGFIALPADRAFEGKCVGRCSRDSLRGAFVTGALRFARQPA